MPVGLTKNYKQAAEGIVKYLKDPITTLNQRKIGEKVQEVIEVVGIYKQFDFIDLDLSE